MRGEFPKREDSFLMRRWGRGSRLTAALLIFLLHASGAAAGMKEVAAQLEEVRLLLRDRRYSTALDDLKFVAEQIQDLRLGEMKILFPAPPEGWTATPAMRTSREGELWSRRLESRRTYTPENKEGKVEVVLDFYSPLIPGVSLSFNPLYLVSEPRAKIVDLAGEPARLDFNPDTGEGKLVLILQNRILISISGRGIASESTLKEFAALLDLPALRNFTLP